LHDADDRPDIFDRSNQVGIVASTMSFSRFLFTFNNDYRKKKRSNNKNPVKNEGDKRARTDSTTNLIIKGEPSFVSSPTVTSFTARTC